jgi:Transposase DDE domain group 1
VKRTSWSHGLSVSADGMGVVPLAGAVAVRLLADRVGLTDALSTALSRGGFVPVHDRGRVWVDIATMLAAGGEAIADIDTLRHQSELLGVVASPPTVWRALDEATSTALKRVEKARAQTRRHVWSQLACVPASKAAGGDLGETVVLDVDATLIISHSEKEQATATFKTASASTPSAFGVTTPPSCWRSCCGRATRAATMPGTTSRCWLGRSPRSRRLIASGC